MLARCVVDPTEPQREGVFATTRWTLVLQAAQPDLPAADHALAELCGAYWYPLYAYARRFGHDADTAADLAQGFFARLLEKNFLALANRQRGRFRWFLLTAFKAYMANEHDRAKAIKRGGGMAPLALDALDAEARYALEPAAGRPPDLEYERQWAFTLIERATGRLRTEFAEAGRAARFEVLEQYLPGDEPVLTHAEAALRLGTSEGALKVEVHRLKRRFGEMLRAEVADTVGDPAEVDEELRHLIQVICQAA
jgi:DNA-directed RNA polymerase specialized sigma24 family protein